jgi:hypothetical protein
MKAFLALLVVALGVASAWLWLALQSEQARVEILEAGVKTSDATLPGLDPERPIEHPVDRGGVKVAAGDPAKLPPEDYSAFERRLLKDPSYLEARRRFRQLELAAGHIDLARELGIPESVAQRLIALLVDQELQYLSEPHPNPRNEAERQARQLEISEAEYKADREIAAIIGESKLQAWKDYQASLSVRHQVYRLGATLFAASAPLRQDQVEPLVDAIYAERERAAQELKEYTASLAWSGGMEGKSHTYRNQRRVELRNAADERIHEAAGKILSAKQLQVLDEMLRRERELEEAEFLQYRVTDKLAGAWAKAD